MWWLAPQEAHGGVHWYKGVLVYQRGVRNREYFPMREVPLLFLTFAHTPPEPEPLLAFASSYGPLGQGVGCDAKDLPNPEVPKLVKRSREFDWPGWTESWETLDAWRAAARLLRYGVDLWQAARSGDREALVRLLEPGAEYLRPIPLLPHGSEPLRLSWGWLKGFGAEPGDLIAAGFVSLNLLLTSLLDGLTFPCFTWNSRNRHSVPSYRPKSLWGAMLTQFADALTQDRHFQSCPSCLKWFELAPGVNRSDRTTCSPACRQKQYRQRVDRARQLKAEGMPFRQIAAELGSDPKTIRRWLSRNPKG
jgi:hypothetical protein